MILKVVRVEVDPVPEPDPDPGHKFKCGSMRIRIYITAWKTAPVQETVKIRGRHIIVWVSCPDSSERAYVCVWGGGGDW
jgi:hypothetical protein